MDRVQRYTRGMSFERFVASDVVMDAVARHLGIIGEAPRHSPHVGQQHPAVGPGHEVGQLQDADALQWALKRVARFHRARNHTDNLTCDPVSPLAVYDLTPSPLP